MIDIHSHLIFDVDDGSKSFEESIKYLKEIKEINLDKVICTPHMKKGRREKALKIIENFKILREEAKKLGIILYLGNEIMYTPETVSLLKAKKITTLNRSKYVLIEFKRNESRNIDSIVSDLEELIEEGYVVILAHPECYENYRSIKNLEKLKEVGVLFQMDATSILKGSKRKIRKISKKLLDLKLIDFVASDSHCTKKRNFKTIPKAYKKISKKYGSEYANIIFYENQLKIIDNK